MRSLLDFAKRGPWKVGVRSCRVADPLQPERLLPSDLWYAVAEGVEAEESADHPFGARHRAIPDAPAARGAHPLVVFSHGNSGLRRQSTFLTTHLASWGIAVVAPDHVGNTAPEMAALRTQDERRRVHFEVRERRPREALAALDAALDGRFDAPGTPPRLDASRIAALGHSFGGWTSLKLPRLDPRIRAICAMAPASEPFVGRRAFGDGELPFERPLPSLLLAGMGDVLIDLETSVAPLFSRLGEPSRLIGIEGADHFHFCDNIELLHALHEKNPRPGQPRPTLPYDQTLPAARVQRALCGLVTRFLSRALDANPAGALDDLDAATLRALDPALRPLRY